MFLLRPSLSWPLTAHWDVLDLLAGSEESGEVAL